MHIGVITEYNPFHNGHHYQLQAIKEHFPNKKIIIIMSGDFVQRGEPAIFNKYLRATCALQSGADVLFELPSLFATASAEFFASAAVLSLAATNTIDTLCFGAEDDNLEIYEEIANLLIEEPTEYQNLLKENLKSGLSFPKARALAVSEYLKDDSYETFLKKPNNILGIEYIKTIYKYHLPIKPYIIPRRGNSYHDLSLENPFSSASALREFIKKQSIDKFNTDDYIHFTRNFIPDFAYQTIINFTYNQPLFLSDFYSFLQYALWRENFSYEQYFEVTKELSNQLLNYLKYPISMDTLFSNLSNKNYTNTRIKRALLNILFQNKKEDMLQFKNNHYISYLRLLGFHSTSSCILKDMKKTSSIPIINKVADAKKILPIEAYKQFEKDIKISQLYKQAYAIKYQVSMPTEFEQSVIIQN